MASRPSLQLQLVQALRLASMLGAGVLLGRWLGLGPHLAAFEWGMAAGALLNFAVRNALGAFWMRSWPSAGSMAAKAGFFWRVQLWLLLGLLPLGAMPLLIPTDQTLLWLLPLLFAALQLLASALDYWWWSTGQWPRLLVFSVLSAALYLAVFGLAWLASWPIWLVWTALCAWAALRWGIQLLVLLAAGKPEWNANGTLTRDVRLWLPLLTAALAAGAAEHLDAWLLKLLSTGEQLVLFRYGARELPLTSALAASFSLAQLGLLVQVGAARADRIKAVTEMRRQSLGLMHLGFGLALALMWSAGSLLPLVFGVSFAPAVPVFRLILMLNLWRLMFPQAVVLAWAPARWSALLSWTELLLHVLLSLVLVPQYGAWGVALASVLAYGFEKLVLLILATRLGIPLGVLVPWKWWLLYSSLLLLSYMLLSSWLLM